MSQQLNLFDPALRPRHDWLSLANVLLGGALILALLLVLGSWGKHKESQALLTLKQQAVQLQAAQAQLVELAAMQASRRTDPVLEKQLAGKRLLLTQKHQVLELLEGGKVGGQEGFSALMEALARQVPDGLWLQSFDFRSGGRVIILRGGLVSESQLPQYVQQLNQEPLVRGRQFAALQLLPVAPVSGSSSEGAEAVGQQGYLQFVLEGVGLDDGEAR